MNEMLKTIYTRRSIRGFTDAPVKDELLDAIVEAGRCAPNAWNEQQFGFVVIRCADILDKLAELTARYLEGKVSDHRFFGAPQIILVTHLRDNDMRFADTGCAMQNMMLAAHSLGFGSVWVNQLYPLHDNPEVMTFLQTLGIGSERMVCAALALGEPAVPPRPKQLTSRVHYIDQDGRKRSDNRTQERD